MKTQTLAGPKFESNPCTRCNGAGQRKGFACVPCEGSGAVLTRRGRAAREYMRRLLVKPIQDVQVGDVIEFIIGNLKITSAVNRVELLSGSRVRVHGVRKKTGDDIAVYHAVGKPIQMVYTVQELEVIRADVEAYQAGLTKTGVVAAKRLKPTTKAA
jgi:hypothetical protein